MKNRMTFLALALASMGAAHAQSSVTLFGVLDAGVRYTKSGDVDRKLVSSGGLNTSRLGFRGIEDLGNGLKAGFWLESQVNGDDGTTQSRFWHRRSTVSLIGGFGEVRLGRDFSPVYRVITAADPFGDTGLGAIADQMANTTINGASYDTFKRLDNAVSYFLPDNMGGLTGMVTVAPGEGTTGKKLIGGNLGFKVGPVLLAGAYSETEIIDEDVKNWALTAAYDIGTTKLMAGYSELKYLSAKERHANVGAVIPAGPGSIRVSYVYTQGSGSTFEADGEKDKSQKIALGYEYTLSKRTSVYTTAAYVKNENGARFIVNQAPTLTSSSSSRGVDLGIKHSF